MEASGGDVETRRELFLVESYVPLTNPALISAILAQLRDAARALRTGQGWVLVRSCIALPTDETCFYLVESESSDEVQRVFTQAAISYERIVKAFQITDRLEST